MTVCTCQWTSVVFLFFPHSHPTCPVPPPPLPLLVFLLKWGLVQPKWSGTLYIVQIYLRFTDIYLCLPNANLKGLKMFLLFNLEHEILYFTLLKFSYLLILKIFVYGWFCLNIYHFYVWSHSIPEKISHLLELSYRQLRQCRNPTQDLWENSCTALSPALYSCF